MEGTANEALVAPAAREFITNTITLANATNPAGIFPTINGTNVLDFTQDRTGTTTAGTVTVTSSSVATPTVQVASVPAGLFVGATLMGRTITSITGNTITLNAAPAETIASATVRPFESNIVTNVTSNAGLFAGMVVSGPGIVPGTTVTTFSSTASADVLSTTAPGFPARPDRDGDSRERARQHVCRSHPVGTDGDRHLWQYRHTFRPCQ